MRASASRAPAGSDTPPTQDDAGNSRPGPDSGRLAGRRPRVLVLLLASLAGAGPPSDDLAQPRVPGPLHVRAQLSGPPRYVGQSLLLEVSATAGRERPAIVDPKLTGASVKLIGVDLRPLSASGIGSLVMERNLFLWRYRVVPQRAGLLNVPPVVVKLGDRSAASRPLRVAVADVPAEGRSSAFLGGVGSFELEAEASSASVRLGQSFEYRLRVSGPAARTMTHAAELAPLPPGVTVRPEPAETVDEPPTRVFRYTVRPTRPGRLVLPPVAVAAFDPRSGRYMTRVSRSVAVRVADVERFDPSRLAYARAAPSDGWRRPLAAATGVVLALAALVVGAWVILRNRVRRLRHAWSLRRLIARLKRGFEAGGGSAAETGRLITDGLAEYLHLVQARPRGALTPGEAEACLSDREETAALASRGGRLVELCDQAQFAGRRPRVEDLLREARALFDALGRSEAAFETPREAARTAPSPGAERSATASLRPTPVAASDSPARPEAEKPCSD